MGAAVLVARLASEATMMHTERHILYGNQFDRWGTFSLSPGPLEDSKLTSEAPETFRQGVWHLHRRLRL